MSYNNAISPNELITENDIKNSVNTIYVFGDNMMKIGNGGQALIARQYVSLGKAIGIPTKRKPAMTEQSFFSDKADEICAVKAAFYDIIMKKKRRI